MFESPNHATTRLNRNGSRSQTSCVVQADERVSEDRVPLVVVTMASGGNALAAESGDAA